MAPLIRPAKHGGRPRSVDVRAVVLNAVFHVLSTGCRLARDLERHCRIAAAFVRRVAVIRIMLRRLAAKPAA